jgi:hypothetical protein
MSPAPDPQSQKTALDYIARRSSDAIPCVDRRWPGVGQAISALVGGDTGDKHGRVWNSWRALLAGVLSISCKRNNRDNQLLD